MKKIVHINVIETGSTGNIMMELASLSRECGDEVYTVSGFHHGVSEEYKKVDSHIHVGGRIGRKLHRLYADCTGKEGHGSFFSTIAIINKIKKLEPDIVHLHIMHSCYINLPLLFRYLRRNQTIKVFWTLHDCWAITGGCPYYDMNSCDGWMNGCYECKFQYKKNPNWAVKNLNDKKKWLIGMENLTLVTPSKWLNGEIKKSYLRDFKSVIVKNGIDLDIYKPTSGSFRERYKLKDKFIILGVAFVWNKRKGIDFFSTISPYLSDEYRIVLVGKMPSGTGIPDDDKIIKVGSVTEKKQMAEIYTASDVFLNPTREEMFGMVNVESLACGTPVITFNSGGSPESIDSSCGVVIEKEDAMAAVHIIKELKNGERIYTKENCIKRAQFFDKNETYKGYLELYRNFENS